VRKLALENELALVRHFDTQINVLETQLQRITKQVASRDYTLLQTIPGIGQYLGLTILYEIGDKAEP
jgi:transposase